MHTLLRIYTRWISRPWNFKHPENWMKLRVFSVRCKASLKWNSMIYLLTASSFLCQAIASDKRKLCGKSWHLKNFCSGILNGLQSFGRHQFPLQQTFSLHLSFFPHMLRNNCYLFTRSLTFLDCVTLHFGILSTL